MILRRFVLILGATPFVASATDPRSRVAADAPAAADRLIDVPRGVFFGFALGTTEDQLFAKSGKPTGYMRLNDRETVAIYGKDVAFIFDQGRLNGIRITDPLIDWELSKLVRSTAPFESSRWHFENGLRYGTTLAEARRVVGARLQGERYNASYMEGRTRVSLNFIAHSMNPSGEGEFTLGGIFIRAGQ